MDSTQSQAATSSSSPTSAHTEEPSHSAASESKALRTSARVKAAKQKEKQKDRSSADTQQASSSTSKRARDSSSNKGKGKEVADESRASKRYVRSFFRLTPRLNMALHDSARRSTYPATSALTINEPTKDTKGKKRAAPEDHSEDDETAAASTASKKLRHPTSAYSLRPRSDNQAASDMTRKTRCVSCAYSGSMVSLTPQSLQSNIRQG